MVDGLHGQTARVNDFGTLIINIYYEIIYMQIKKNIGYIKKISIFQLQYALLVEVQQWRPTTWTLTRVHCYVSPSVADCLNRFSTIN